MRSSRVHDLNSISTFVKLNGLKIIVAKTQLMILNRKNEDNKAEQIQVTFDGINRIEQAVLCQVLGCPHRQRSHLEVHIAKPPSTKMSGQAGYD